MTAVKRSSGNVFDDLGLAGAGDRLVKAELIRNISDIIQSRKLTQKQAADILALDQPKVSALVRGVVTGFSTDRLLRLLMALDQDIDIIVKRKPSRSKRLARVTVFRAA